MGIEGGIVNDYDDEKNSFNFTPRKKSVEIHLEKN